MITQIHAQNFKSWKDTGDLRLAPLTGLFGANNSGKTSILQTLLLMKQTVEYGDHVLNTTDNLVKLGAFSDIIHGHQLDAQFRFSFSWKLHEPLIIKESGQQDKNIQELSFTTRVHWYKGRPTVESFVYEFDSRSFGITTAMNTGTPTYTFILDHSAKTGGLPPPKKCYGFPDNLTANRATVSVMDFASALEDEFHRLVYLGSNRNCAQRNYGWTGQHPDSVGIQGEHVLDVFLAARVDSAVGFQKEQLIRDWLQKMNLVYSYDPKRISKNNNDYEIRVKTSRASPEVLITDVGSGFPQIFPVLTQCCYAQEHSIILLEQPETHLHPAAQAELADILIDVVKDKKRNIQIILESHSEHLLRRLQRRIAEEKLSPNDVALYFCHMENGESKIEELNVDEYGNIQNWPQNFFGDEMGDLVAMTEAAMKRETESDS